MLNAKSYWSKVHDSGKNEASIGISPNQANKSIVFNGNALMVIIWFISYNSLMLAVAITDYIVHVTCHVNVVIKSHCTYQNLKVKTRIVDPSATSVFDDLVVR